MATRREQLAALSGDSGGGNSGESDDKDSGIPFPIFLEEQTVSDDAYQTRVKVSEKPTPKEKTDTKPTFAERKTQRVGTASERQIAEIEDALIGKLDDIAVLTRDFLPVTSVYMAERGPHATKALLSIAKRRPKLLKALEKAADGVDAVEVAKFVAGIVWCIQVDFGRVDGTDIPSQVLGVTSILDEYFTDREKPDTNPSVLVQAPNYVPVV